LIERAHFTNERSYNAAPAEVFAVWSSAKAKWRWFAGPEDWEIEPFEPTCGWADASGAAAARKAVPSTAPD
jgi:uncharacterized protein YndB with AHSA1/START domain